VKKLLFIFWVFWLFLFFGCNLGSVETSVNIDPVIQDVQAQFDDWWVSLQDFTLEFDSTPLINDTALTGTPVSYEVIMCPYEIQYSIVGDAVYDGTACPGAIITTFPIADYPADSNGAVSLPMYNIVDAYEVYWVTVRITDDIGNKSAMSPTFTAYWF